MEKFAMVSIDSDGIIIYAEDGSSINISTFKCKDKDGNIVAYEDERGNYIFVHKED